MWRTTLVLSIVLAASAEAETAKIVGHGASRCSTFTRDVQHSAALEREYFAWAQGFMSGALIRAPSGVDQDIDLLPGSLPAGAQINFLRDYCSKNSDQDYMDAARALYHRLREAGQ